MVADFQGPNALVRHMTVSASHLRTRMDPLVPHLEFRMLCLEYGRSCISMNPVLKLRLIVVAENLLDLEPLCPRICETLVRALKVIFDMALAAHESPHFLSGGIPVDIVISHALGGLQSAYSFYETRARDAQLHCGRIMAINAGDGMGNQLASLRIGLGIHDLKSFDQIAVPCLLIRDINGRMALQTRTGLWRRHLTLGEHLIFQHVGVTSFLTKVSRKGDRKSTRLNSSHLGISYAVFCLKKKKN